MTVTSTAQDYRPQPSLFLFEVETAYGNTASQGCRAADKSADHSGNDRHFRTDREGVSWS